MSTVQYFIDFPYQLISVFQVPYDYIDSHRVSIQLFYMGILWGQRPLVKFCPIECPYDAFMENCGTKAKLL